MELDILKEIALHQESLSGLGPTQALGHLPIREGPRLLPSRRKTDTR